MKLEELARRADDKHKQINDLQKKLDPERQRSPLRDSHAARASIDDARSEYSEFSAITNEPELRNDENILDFCVEDAEFFHETFKQLPNGNQLQ
jgi:hypothetical protein